MLHVLMILEVSQKQTYIFASKYLKDNAVRSEIIRYVTSGKYFEKVCSDFFSEEDNMVYSGGGHTVLQFEDDDSAKQFARKITLTVMQEYTGLELFVKQIPYDSTQTLDKNIKKLMEVLEQKKSIRKSAFRQGTFGVEKLDNIDFQPVILNNKEPNVNLPAYFEDYILPTEFSELTGKDNFIAVIHIDGNAMGARVQRLNEHCNINDHESIRNRLHRFSEGVDRDFGNAFDDTVRFVIDMKKSSVLDSLELDDNKILPIRRVIRAGDDVCFVTAGKIGLECAAAFLRALSGRKNAEDDKGYSACAGVAIVHKKFPFHRAYELSEQLCSNAKKYGLILCGDGSVSAIDWHMEFGQLKENLSEIRRDFRTEDGCHLELRPMIVCGTERDTRRHYDCFIRLVKQLNENKFARSKVKGLRNALKFGQFATVEYLNSNKLTDLLYEAFTAHNGVQLNFDESDKAAFQDFKYSENSSDDNKTETRCLYYDAIEIMDYIILSEEAKA